MDEYTIAHIKSLEEKTDQQQTEIDALREQLFTLSKTVEGVQNLFIRAGEYKGKPRGRLPR